MNKVSSYEKTLNQKIFEVIDNWAAENRIKSDADILRKINSMFPERQIEQGRFSRLRNCKERIKVDELILIADCLNIPIDELVQRDISSNKKTAADILSFIFGLRKLTHCNFMKTEIPFIYEKKEFTGIYFDEEFIIKGCTMDGSTKYFLNDAIESWHKFIESISNFPYEVQEKMLQDWESAQLKTAQNIIPFDESFELPFN